MIELKPCPFAESFVSEGNVIHVYDEFLEDNAK